MNWKKILKTKTEKPTKLVNGPSPEYYDRDAEAYGNSQNVYGQHFNTCEIGDYYGYPSPHFKEKTLCNCYRIAKDWVNESEFVKNVLMDEGVGALNSRGESSVTMESLERMERIRQRKEEKGLI